jgi:lipopolysaccharide export system protein LptA
MKFISLILIFLFPCVVVALEADKNEPLSIQAERVFLNHHTGMNTYEGHVRLLQGTSELTADKISVRFDTANRLDKIVAEGAPARYRTLFEKEKPEITAVANAMEYYPKEGTLILVDNAKIVEGKNIFEGSRIEYNIQKKIVTSATANNGQIHIVLQPHEN